MNYLGFADTIFRSRRQGRNYGDNFNVVQMLATRHRLIGHPGVTIHRISCNTPVQLQQPPTNYRRTTCAV